jgi:hypothetical protein
VSRVTLAGKKSAVPDAPRVRNKRGQWSITGAENALPQNPIATTAMARL